MDVQNIKKKWCCWKLDTLKRCLCEDFPDKFAVGFCVGLEEIICGKALGEVKYGTWNHNVALVTDGWV